EVHRSGFGRPIETERTFLLDAILVPYGYSVTGKNPLMPSVDGLRTCFLAQGVVGRNGPGSLELLLVVYPRLFSSKGVNEDRGAVGGFHLHGPVMVGLIGSEPQRVVLQIIAQLQSRFLLCPFGDDQVEGVRRGEHLDGSPSANVVIIIR